MIKPLALLSVAALTLVGCAKQDAQRQQMLRQLPKSARSSSLPKLLTLHLTIPMPMAISSASMLM